MHQWLETVVGILPNGTTTTINDLLLLIQDKAACAVVLGHPTLIIDLQPWQPHWGVRGSEGGPELGARRGETREWTE